MRGAAGPIAAGAVGLLAAAGLLPATTALPALRPGSLAWSRLVLGPADGALAPGLVVRLPGLERRPGDRLLVEADPGTALGLAVDRGPVQPLRVSTGPALVALPERAIPGLRLDLRSLDPGAAGARVHSLTLQRQRRGGWTAPLLAGLAAGLLVLGLAGRLGATAAAGLGLLCAGLSALAAAPAFLLLALPDPEALARLALPLALLAGAGLAWRRLDASRRGAFTRLALLVGALVFGAWIRGAFLASPGSWDTEYWKAWMLRASSAGVTRVYGDADAVPPGHLLAQLRGREELWKARAFGREFVVDYPPLAMALWRVSWALVHAAAPRLDGAEALNVAVKLPAVLGDVAALAVLLWAFPRRPWLGLGLAALYWALPVSWFASAVLGYLDGAYAPLAAAAVLAAGRGRPRAAGLLLALACLVKPTAVVVAPALIVALRSRRAPVGPALLAGLLAVAAALVPFAVAGTLATAVVHVYRILFQGTLSGGFANPWWVVGHLANGGGLGDPVAYARLAGLGFDPRPIGAVLFGLAAAAVAWRQRRAPGVGPAALAAAALVFAYGMCAVGVHDNHPYPLLLLLLLTGLPSAWLRALAGALCASLVLNSVALSGLGRLGVRHEVLEPLGRWLAGLRMALGFDLTLALAALHTLLFLALLARLGRETRRLAEAAPA